MPRTSYMQITDIAGETSNDSGTSVGANETLSVGANDTESALLVPAVQAIREAPPKQNAENEKTTLTFGLEDGQLYDVTRDVTHDSGSEFQGYQQSDYDFLQIEQVSILGHELSHTIQQAAIDADGMM